MLCFEGRHTVLEGELWPEDSLGDAFLPRDVCLPRPLSSRLLPALSPQTRDSESSTQKGQTGRKSEGVLGKDRPRDQRDISEAFGDSETPGDQEPVTDVAPARPLPTKSDIALPGLRSELKLHGRGGAGLVRSPEPLLPSRAEGRPSALKLRV